MMMVGGPIVFFLTAQVSLQSRLRTHTKIPTDNSQCYVKQSFFKQKRMQPRARDNIGLLTAQDTLHLTIYFHC